MEQQNQTIASLHNNETLFTEEKRTAYKVKTGKVVIFAAPFKNDMQERMVFLHEAAAGETIPALHYTDMDGVEWKFCLKAMEPTQLYIIENGATGVLKRKFAARVSLPNFTHEGFERSVVEYYEGKSIEEDSLIYRTKKEKKKNDAEAAKLLSSIFQKAAPAPYDEEAEVKLYETVRFLCQRYGISVAPLQEIRDHGDGRITVDSIARVSEFCCRQTRLDAAWYQRDAGPVIAFEKDGNPMACIPSGRKGYMAHDVGSGKGVLLNERNVSRFKHTGYVIYRTFPDRKMELQDIIRFCRKGIKGADLMAVAAFTLTAAVVGVTLPVMTGLVFDRLVPEGLEWQIAGLCCFVAALLGGKLFFDAGSTAGAFRISRKLSYMVQSASYERVFRLPERFLRQYDSAELSGIVMSTGPLISSAAYIALTWIVTGICSVVYLISMVYIAAVPAALCTAVLALYAVAVYLISSAALKHRAHAETYAERADSLLHQFLSGIEKIKLAGVEKRALYEYYKPFSKKKELETKAEKMTTLARTLEVMAEGVFALTVYAVVLYGGVELTGGAFLSFVVSLGFFSSAVRKAADGAIVIREMEPIYDRFSALMEAVPEGNAGKAPADLRGSITMDNVRFSYEDAGPYVIDGLSLDIAAGEYIGIVGDSGCGKTTLLKLLLGFEKTNGGRICYDGTDLELYSLRELRKKMGAVLQDGSLISGSIYENITIMAPDASAALVERIVDVVGLREDVENMPMGLHTVLREDGRTISGGQLQRILIARALISDPTVIFFDEATSALDNIAQKAICDILASLEVTRIVVAHRLSTVMKCDRILVMDHGRIVEEGDFETLMALRGHFFRLARRQM